MNRTALLALSEAFAAAGNACDLEDSIEHDAHTPGARANLEGWLERLNRRAAI